MNEPEGSGMQPAQVLAFPASADHPPVLLPDGSDLTDNHLDDDAPRLELHERKPGPSGS